MNISVQRGVTHFTYMFYSTTWCLTREKLNDFGQTSLTMRDLVNSAEAKGGSHRRQHNER